MLDAQLHQSVIDHDGVTGADVLGQPRIVDAADLVITGNIPRGQRIHGAVLDFHGAARERAQTPLRALGIQHGRNRQAELLAQAHDLLKTLPVLLVVRVGEVEPRIWRSTSSLSVAGPIVHTIFVFLSCCCISVSS